MRTILLFSTLTLLLSACDMYKQDAYVQEYVVDSWLVAQNELPPINLSKTAPIDVVYNRSELGVTDASIVVKEINANGSTNWVQVYQHVINGRYEPIDASRFVQANTRYELEVIVGLDNHLISAYTVVPDTFSILSLNHDRLPYQGPEQFAVKLTSSDNIDRQTYFVVSTETLDPQNAELTPFYANFDVDRDELYRVSSGIFNESNQNQSGSGEIELVYPWIGIAYYGPNRIVIASIDDNAYDFIRSSSTQLGGGTQSPGEIENLLYNVDGGIGIFGSYSKVTIDVIVD
ncbi:MAG: DUF4249 domain-containing protein [Balneolales bacterium]|nr:DUF4249 domain-containing protein [Balneolales bacterium]